MNISLRDAFGIVYGDVVSLVGGGGKTTLMYALARELAAEGQKVITTTTTRIAEPSTAETELLIIEADAEKMIETVTRNLERHNHITVASHRIENDKLKGITPGLVVRLAALNGVSSVIVEADGSAGRSLKAPNNTEPVIPSNISLVVAVVGIDALGKPLTEEYVHRPQIAAALLGVAEGTILTAEHMAVLLTHPTGIAKGSPASARIIPFINKVNIKDGLVNGRKVAEAILARHHPQIDRVLLGQAKLPEPVCEIRRV